MSKLILPCVLISAMFYASGYSYNGSTTASVTLAGGIVSAKYSHVDKKYKRSECPVCKGKGWYISGDNIKKVECGYCEPDQQQNHTQVFKR